MVYGILNARTGKRARHLDSTLTPVFDYPVQASRYIYKFLGDSKYVKIRKLKG